MRSGIAEAAVGENNLAALTDAEWDSLEKLPSEAPMDLPIIARLRTLYLFHGLVRTDAEGGYEITGPRGGETYALIAFARDHLPAGLTPKGAPNPVGILYTLISDGIHSKTDSECIEIFDDCKAAFEFVVKKLSEAKKDDEEYLQSVLKIKKRADGK